MNGDAPQYARAEPGQDGTGDFCKKTLTRWAFNTPGPVSPMATCLPCASIRQVSRRHETHRERRNSVHTLSADPAPACLTLASPDTGGANATPLYGITAMRMKQKCVLCVFLTSSVTSGNLSGSLPVDSRRQPLCAPLQALPSCGSTYFPLPGNQNVSHVSDLRYGVYNSVSDVS